jgi:hypothetical protein
MGTQQIENEAIAIGKVALRSMQYNHVSYQWMFGKITIANFLSFLRRKGANLLR